MRSATYDADIEKMYGTADADLTFTETAGKIKLTNSGYGYSYYPTGLDSLARLVQGLFSKDEQGGWYDPSDRATMFQDAAGTTPVTAVEQPVGLVLDKSKGLVLGPELALCYDPLRGGVNQAWLGTLDLAATLRAKINQPAVVHGEAFYRETTLQPLRVGSSEKAPVRRFKGYRYEKDAVVFDFTLDGVLVRETLRAMADGKGIVREWSVPAGVVLYFQTDAQKDASVSFSGADEVKPGIWRHEGGDGKVFIMTIQPKKKS